MEGYTPSDGACRLHAFRRCTPSDGACLSPGDQKCSSDGDLEYSLVDMPAHWLDQLAQLMGHSECLDLFRTCRAMRDLILTERTLHVYASVPLLDSPALSSDQARLVLACQRSSSVDLILYPEFQAPDQDEIPAATTNASATQLMYNTMAAIPDNAMSSVRSVVLSSLYLDVLVPHWLTTTCPNMTSLELQECRNGHLQGPLPDILVCSQLKELKLTGHQMYSSIEQWQDQLRALPGLGCLSLARAEFLDCSCPAAGHTCGHTQLTRLTLRDFGPLDLQHLASWFPNLVEMHLPLTTIGDEDIEALLILHHLSHISCKGFHLYYSHDHCPWMHLAFQDLDVPSLDRLPLNGTQSLQLVPGLGLLLHLYPSDDVDVNNRVAASIQSCGGLRWDWQASPQGPKVVFDHRWYEHEDDPGFDGTLLATCLPVVAFCQPSSFAIHRAKPFTTELLAALTQHLSNCTVTSVELYDCSFATGVVSTVLPNLPPDVRDVRLVAMPSFTEADLIELCVHACRPIAIEVTWGVGASGREGWARRPMGAMAAAGHRHVALSGYQSEDWEDWDCMMAAERYGARETEQLLQIEPCLRYAYSRQGRVQNPIPQARSSKAATAGKEGNLE